ncbi:MULTISPECIES: hypothetical protein [Prochlorococcus]|uniref:hypothetical protein n=1 Tax=Prochlorococcus TaxID=1218 RepID=UPI0007B36F65|nr:MULTISPECIES: hypothetical protein [Prochlorococcus]KZR60697.1 hypothetical protein PMIT1312_02365 [Prochlorococcus marinus str. MIT 1312]KZR79551.1 hypothetical protein PMIT1327_01610 [Prochlorococcus marinus str. MIT 1327]NMO84713.1 hypothetical protein [Prochlorococcus sp. P1344]NMP06738.1 hypothetical protein [Prochlorococcus sp. P1361]NMP13695.1 hypothetical protein [Prochlorococcus sp.P1363]
MQRFEPDQQIASLKKQSQRLSLTLYHDLALYLQLLRRELLNVVRQALFLLITDRDQNRLSGLSDKTRTAFQDQVEQLVCHCCSLLTVEQLMDLVRQMERERQRKSDQNRRELLLAFRSEQDSMQEAEGSIHLSLDPPLEHPDRLGSMLTFDHDPQNAGLSTGLASNEDVDEPDLGKDDQAQLDSQELELASEDSEPIGGQKGDLDVLRSLFVMAGETMATENILTSEFSDLQPGDNTLLHSGLDEEQVFLPVSPLELARWLESLDRALARRLRNLSHALNVEMLRAGIVNSLLPISLLDAVLNGQLESEPVASNLLRLRVPVSTNPMVLEGMEIICVLLRPSEMEFDDPRLRRCRAQLKRHRHTLLKMVRQQRHWQRRAMAQEVKQQWWQSPSANPPTSPPKV